MGYHKLQVSNTVTMYHNNNVEERKQITQALEKFVVKMTVIMCIVTCICRGENTDFTACHILKTKNCHGTGSRCNWVTTGWWHSSYKIQETLLEIQSLRYTCIYVAVNSVQVSTQRNTVINISAQNEDYAAYSTICVWTFVILQCWRISNWWVCTYVASFPSHFQCEKRAWGHCVWYWYQSQHFTV